MGTLIVFTQGSVIAPFIYSIFQSNKFYLIFVKLSFSHLDAQRIRQKNIKKKSIKNKIDPKITNRIWKNMIMSYIDFEKRNFKKK